MYKYYKIIHLMQVQTAWTLPAPFPIRVSCSSYITKTRLYISDPFKPHFYIVKLAVLTSTHNLCFEQKYEKYQSFSSENFPFLEVKFSIYLNRRIFVMSHEKRRLVFSSYKTSYKFVLVRLRKYRIKLKLVDSCLSKPTTSLMPLATPEKELYSLK